MRSLLLGLAAVLLLVGIGLMIVVTQSHAAPAGGAAGPAPGAAAGAAGPVAGPPPTPGQEFAQKIPSGLEEEMKMKWVKPGRFTWKNPKAGEEEIEVKGFWMASTETTWDVYNIWRMAKDLPPGALPTVQTVSRPSPPYADPTYGAGYDGTPVMSTHQNAGQAFAQWLSAQTGRKYRLPTEAEWEYACRAGAPIKPVSKAELDKVAWFKGNSDTTGNGVQMQPVGQKDPNAWGLYDMLGNAGEWCVNADGSAAVRGGTYQNPAEAVHPGARAEFDAKWQVRDCQLPKSKWWLSDASFAGFRVICEP